MLFIQGGGEEGYEADSKLAASLRTALGEGYEVHYPQMPTDEALPDFGWLKQIGREITAVKGNVILVGHSLGASMILKYLSENEVKKNVKGIFLIATPLWSGNEDWVQGLKLKDNFAETLPRDVPIFFYHCRDDEEVPFDHLKYYKQKITWGAFLEIADGGHQFNNDLSPVAKDIKTL